MAQGHTIPLLDLSRALSRRDLKVTIITTPSNAHTIVPYISKYSNIHLREIPFPKVHGLPEGCENMSQTFSSDHLLPFLNATKLLREPFEATLRDMCQVDQDRPTCVISDSFLGWTNALCQSLGLPRVVFHGMGVFSMTVKKSMVIYQTHSKSVKGNYSDDDVLEVKGVDLPFHLKRADLPNSLRETDCRVSEFFTEAERSDLGSWAVIANSFMELDKDYVLPLESLYGNGTRVFCLGPLFLYDQMEGDGNIGPNGPDPSEEWADWLNQRVDQEKYVLYVSFGSQAKLCDEQLDELAYGLEKSGVDYIWVVRSKTWSPPSGLISGGVTKGLIVRQWVDQKWVLAHRAVGGFLSHSGWNSTLESLGYGVPILAWPMQAEQHLNAKYLVEGLKVGIGLPSASARDGRIVRREEIREGVEELMRGVRGKQAREKAIELGRMAKRAIQVGGSSYSHLNEIIQRVKEEKLRVDSVS